METPHVWVLAFAAYVVFGTPVMVSVREGVVITLPDSQITGTALFHPSIRYSTIAHAALSSYVTVKSDILGLVDVAEGLERLKRTVSLSRPSSWKT